MKYKKIVLLAGIMATTNLNAEETTQLEPVTVISTATRTEQPVEGVTASVIVIEADDIEKTGAQTLKDVFNNTPGLIIQYGTFPASSSASKSSVSIRGVGATGTLWLLDGRRLSGEVKNPYDMDRIPASMIERIEIVKGPMSALYGADAVGGVINIITKKPEKGFQGSVSVRAGANTDGDAEQLHLNGNIRGGKGKIRYSLYGSIQSTEPYPEVENTNTRVGGGQHKPSQVPPSPGFLNPNGPSGGRPFYLQADGSVKPAPLNPANLPTDIQAVQADFDRFRGQVQANVKDSYLVDVTYREESDINTVGGRLEVDLLESLTTGLEFNWFEEEREGIYRAAFHPMGFLPPVGHKTNPIVGHNPDGTPISFFQQFGKLKGKIPSWDVPVRSRDENERLDISADAKWDATEWLQVNARVYRSDYEKRNQTTMFEFADFGYPNEEKSSASGMNANVEITAFESWATLAAGEAHLLTFGGEVRDEKREATVFSQGPGFDTRSVSYAALYLQDEWDLNSLNLTLGGRYDQYKQDSYIDALGNQRDETDDSEPTFRIGMVNNFSPAFNLRLNFAQAYRIPDIRELFIQKQTPAGLQLGAQAISPAHNKLAHELEPETTDAYEVGFSGRADAFSYEAVVFHNQIKNRIQQVTVDFNGDNIDDYFTFNNVSEAETTGLELTLGYQFNKALDLNIFWTELDTENKDTGKELEFNPERTIAASLAWAATDQLNLGVNATYTGEQFYIQNGQDKTADGYTLVNLNGSYSFGKNNRFEIFGGADNIFDEKVDTRLGSNVGTFIFSGLRANF